MPRLWAATALESARHALAFNPLQEEVQRDVIGLLYLNGDRAGVIQQYEALRLRYWLPTGWAYGVYRRLGFDEMGKLSVYLWDRAKN